MVNAPAGFCLVHKVFHRRGPKARNLNALAVTLHVPTIDAGVPIFFATTPRHGSGPPRQEGAEVAPAHSALVRGAPPQHDEDDEQCQQPDNTGAQHRWRGGAHPLVGLLSAGSNALRGLLGLLLGLR